MGAVSLSLSWSGGPLSEQEEEGGRSGGMLSLTGLLPTRFLKSGLYRDLLAEAVVPPETNGGEAGGAGATGGVSGQALRPLLARRVFPFTRKPRHSSPSPLVLPQPLQGPVGGDGDGRLKGALGGGHHPPHQLSTGGPALPGPRAQTSAGPEHPLPCSSSMLLVTPSPGD